MPFAIAFGVGLYLRLRASGLVRLVIAGPGGIVGGLRRLLVFGLLQRRVAHRPRGWPHVGIFYGFLTLLFGTTVVALDWDVLRPLGVRILSGSPYLYFKALLDALGLVFVISLIAALAWRLIKLRSTGPDQRRMQWQFVLLIVGLLYMGTTGFILEGLRLTLRPVPWADWSFIGNELAGPLHALGLEQRGETTYLALWWSHAVVAFTLIAALPYFAFLHSVAAPLNLMVHPGHPKLALDAPFDLREIEASGNFDVKVGASTLADLNEAQRFALMACTNCGRCDNVCPAFASGTALSPRQLVQGLRGMQMARNSRTDLLASGDVSAPALWACTTCGACVQACPVLIRPVDYIVPFRRELVTRQQIDKRQIEFLGNLGRSFNPYGLPPANRSRLAAELNAADTAP
ncbi:MAG TPA: 4Fe-4S dicluster domain-containing protein [Acidobacteriaceae bacterium]|nr:4Fe-4S dicluster domain-containing protein [Acidobacteriaceae bacterium]